MSLLCARRRIVTLSSCICHATIAGHGCETHCKQRAMSTFHPSKLVPKSHGRLPCTRISCEPELITLDSLDIVLASSVQAFAYMASLPGGKASWTRCRSFAYFRFVNPAAKTDPLGASRMANEAIDLRRLEARNVLEGSMPESNH